VYGEPERLQRALENVEHFSAGWGHARTADQLGCELNGVDRIRHRRSVSKLPMHSKIAAWRSCAARL
jgi:hypothetical protein